MNSETHHSSAGRVGILDALRALASLSVVVWHYQHFFFDPVNGTISLHADQLPGRFLLGPFFDRGAYAVDLFFVLSGYVFYSVYSDTIAKRGVGFREFMVLRLTRLYPLHLLTFAAVALLQFLYFMREDTYFVFQDQSWRSALLNVLFVGTGGFNAPVWSISVELVLYVVFFATSWLRLNGASSTWLLVVGATILSVKFPRATALASFFLGGGCAHLVRWALAGSPHRARLSVAGAGLALAGGIAWLFVDTKWQLRTFEPIARVLTSLVVDRHLSPQNMVNRAFGIALEVVVFPSLVVVGALGDNLLKTKRLSWLVAFGNSTYAVYLCHFPVQIIIAILCRKFGLGVDIFYSPWVLAAYLSPLPLLGMVVFYRFERPSQSWLRGRLLPGTPTSRP